MTARTMFRMGFAAEPWFGPGPESASDARARRVEELGRACADADAAASEYRTLADADAGYLGAAARFEEVRRAVCARYQEALTAHLGSGRKSMGADYASPIDFGPAPGIRYAPMPVSAPKRPPPPPRGVERADLVGPITVNMPREEIENGNGELLKRQPVPKGWTSTFPYVVKVENKGEYLVYADGTAQYIEYGTGRVYAPKRIEGAR